MTQPMSQPVSQPAAAAIVPDAPAAAGRREKKRPQMGPIRVNLEAFGVAILAAVLLKWFCIEAFQIPTSSMQPTLMGDTAAGVYDRILVDKILPTFRDPQRWDITVFKYPLQKNQNYVKRLVGMPGDRLTITGGNIYHVIDEGGRRSYRIERKPDDLQELMWKNVYPGRRLARAESKALGESLAAAPGRAFREDEDGLLIDVADASRHVLSFRDDLDGGFVDRVWDGYPEAVARAIRESSSLLQPQEIVPDGRITAVLTAEPVPDEIAFEIEVQRPGTDKLTFAFVVKAGKGRLQVRTKDAQAVLGESPEFPVVIIAGTATELSFAHVDDQLIAWQDGDELGRPFDCSEWACRDGCALALVGGVLPTREGKLSLPSNHKVVPQIAVRGKGKVRLDDLRIDRDQHYVRLGAPEVIGVPEGHYYMLGDNTLQSVDSRGWTAITIGVDKDGNVVPPDTPGARVVRGNKRAMPLANKPDRDETPIPIPSQKALVMIDEYGEILRLHAEVGPGWGQAADGSSRVSFMRPGADDGHGEWVAPETTNAPGISFVPRADIQGRAVLVFYPSRPLSWLFGNSWPDRFGFVR